MKVKDIRNIIEFIDDDVEITLRKNKIKTDYTWDEQLENVKNNSKMLGEHFNTRCIEKEIHLYIKDGDELKCSVLKVDNTNIEMYHKNIKEIFDFIGNVKIQNK